MLTFPVTKDHKYNQYSCKAANDRLESNRSKQVQINPLSNLKSEISPPFLNENIIVMGASIISGILVMTLATVVCLYLIKRGRTEKNQESVQEESQLPFTSFGKEEAEKKDTEEKGEGNVIPSAETDEKSASSNLKQDGLIYIEVDFANKSGKTDTNVQPMIRGQEDPTEYTFVDFSKKAPPEPDKPENVEEI
ncbi:uncharacterized protein LOC111114983 isoform X2 [Crassostrea virginica]